MMCSYMPCLPINEDTYIHDDDEDDDDEDDDDDDDDDDI